MAGRVKGRRAYHSPLRAEQAGRTRAAVLDAARRLVLRDGYPRLTIAAVAREAGVAVDTVYASVGRKAELVRLLLETAISGTDEAVPAQQRDYVRRVREAPTAREKIALYAAAVAELQPRLGPLHVALSRAAEDEPELASLVRGIGERRRRNMRLFAEDLAATGELRAGLDLDEVADVVWSMNAAEYWVLLVQERGWSAERFGTWLADTWTRLFLAADPPASEPLGAGAPASPDLRGSRVTS